MTESAVVLLFQDREETDVDRHSCPMKVGDQHNCRNSPMGSNYREGKSL